MRQILHHLANGATPYAANMDSLLFGQMPLRHLNVAITPNIGEQGGVIVLLCHDLDQTPAREMRAAISCERATIWTQTTGRELEARLAAMRDRRQEYDLDTPVMQMRLEGVEREREITSRLERKYRVTVFEVSRWFYRNASGGHVARGQQVRR